MSWNKSNNYNNMHGATIKIVRTLPKSRRAFLKDTQIKCTKDVRKISRSINTKHNLNNKPATRR